MRQWEVGFGQLMASSTLLVVLLELSKGVPSIDSF
jgi:hypothetical protein